jgi:hypothetical protein
MAREQRSSGHDEHEVIGSEDARSATKSGRVASVLAISLILAGLVMVAMLYSYWSP